MNKEPINPVCWVSTIYFVMGLPFVALSMVSVLMFSDMEVSSVQIVFWASFIILPQTLKPSWSPFLEISKTKKYFIVAIEIIIGLAFTLVALSLPLPDFFRYAIVLIGIIALSDATHNIASGGVYLAELTATQQARYIGWQGAFYNLAEIPANRDLIWLAGILKGELGVVHTWMIVTLMCTGIMILVGFYRIRTLPSGGDASGEVNTVRDTLNVLWGVIRSFFPKRHITSYIVFIILYRFAEGYVLKIVPLFLKAPVADGGSRLNTQDIGLVYSTFGAGASILGSLLADYYVSAHELRRTSFSLCCAFNIPLLVYSLLVLCQPSNLLIIGTTIVFEYLGYRFGFVGLMFFMVQQVAPGKHQVAHYASATGIMNLGIVLPGMMSGYLSDQLGYRDFFVWVLIATIPAFVVT